MQEESSQKNLKARQMAEMEKGSLESAAKRQLEKLKSALNGCDNINAKLVEDVLEALSEPIQKIYRGQLFQEAEKTWPKIVNNSQTVASAVSESRRLETEIFVETEISNLNAYRKADVELIKALAAGENMPVDLVGQLVEYRTMAFRKAYNLILTEQLPVIFGKKTPIPQSQFTDSLNGDKAIAGMNGNSQAAAASSAIN